MSRRLFSRTESKKSFIIKDLRCYEAPKLDPSVAAATRAQTEMGKEQLAMAREQMNRSNAMSDRFAPVYEQLLDQNIASGQKAEQRADQQWNQYQGTFQPVERQVASEAMNYDSAAETARRTGMAAGTVQKQSDAASEMNARRMAAMGVSPTSGRTTQSMTDNANMTALAKAGAINQERSNTKLTGIQLRQNAAQIGRGLAGNSLAQAGQGLQAGQAAQGTMGAQTGQMTGAMAPALSLYGGAGSSFNSAGQLGLAKYGAQDSSRRAESQDGSQAFGSIVGAMGTMFSSEKGKENKKPVDDDAAMQAMRKVPVKEWDYKEGVGDGGHHIGPMAEDMQAAAGNGVAPGGQAIDVVSAMGMQHAAIRAVDKRLASLESTIGGKSEKKPKAEAMRALPL